MVEATIAHLGTLQFDYASRVAKDSLHVFFFFFSCYCVYYGDAVGKYLSTRIFSFVRNYILVVEVHNEEI